MTRSQHKAPESQHPRFQLNEAIHQPVRLSILSLLAHAEKVEFAFLRDYLGVKDANLSLHLTALESLGYIIVEKGYEKKRPRTWVSLSQSGRDAFDEYIRVFQQIVASPSETPDP